MCSAMSCLMKPSRCNLSLILSVLEGIDGAFLGGIATLYKVRRLTRYALRVEVPK